MKLASELLQEQKRKLVFWRVLTVIAFVVSTVEMIIILGGK